MTAPLPVRLSPRPLRALRRRLLSRHLATAAVVVVVALLLWAEAALQTLTPVTGGIR